MGCTSSRSGAESQKGYFIHKFTQARLANASASSMPQLTVGRIGQIDGILESPLYQKRCAIYQIDMEERDSNGIWGSRFTETRCTTFSLVDPDAAENSLRILPSNAKLLPRIGEDELYKFVPFSSHDNSAPMQDFFIRAGVNGSDLHNYRVRETTLAFNDQLAVLGIIDAQRIVYPATYESVTVGIRTQNRWTSADEKIWTQLIPPGTPQLIFVDDPRYFRGSLVKSLTLQSNGAISNEIGTTAVSTENCGYIRSPVAAKQIYIQLPHDAVAGSQIRVPGPDGNSMLINVPINYTPGRVIELNQ